MGNRPSQNLAGARDVIETLGSLLLGLPRQCRLRIVERDQPPQNALIKGDALLRKTAGCSVVNL